MNTRKPSCHTLLTKEPLSRSKPEVVRKKIVREGCTFESLKKDVAVDAFTSAEILLRQMERVQCMPFLRCERYRYLGSLPK